MPLKYSNDEVLTALKSCSNINAALKSLLKKDVQGNKDLARVIKNLREICQATNNEQRLRKFIEHNIDTYAHVFQALVRHGHFEKIDSITAPVIEQYAEEFNATYKNQANSLVVTDRTKFNQIASKVIDTFKNQLTKCGLTNDNFMLSVLITTLFDPQVVPEIEALV